MMNEKKRNEIIDFLRDNWGDEVIEKIISISEKEYKEISFNDFLSNCEAMGGNWGGMFLTGMRELYPNTYDAVPEDMGIYAFSCICDTLRLCGVQFW